MKVYLKSQHNEDNDGNLRIQKFDEVTINNYNLHC